MAIATGSSIEAVLTLNATGFNNGLTSSLEAVEKFKSTFSSSITPLANNLRELESSLKMLGSTLSIASKEVNEFNVNAKNLSQFSTYATSVNKLANALKILSSDTISAEQSMNVINSMFKYFRDSLNGVEIKVKGVSTVMKELSNTETQGIRVMEQYKLGATNVQSAFTSMSNSTAQGRINLGLYHQNLKALALGVEQFNAIETQHSAKEKEVSASTDKATNSVNRQASAMTKNASATRGLGKALSSLRMMGTMVASMFAYNFAHKLMIATSETVHAKSEMEGYFKMLHFSQGQIDQFNKKLDSTVGQFQRINKYSLGETISSIGVEFDLTTKEMEKAMPVVSMITSEYLRAGRNANEASLAVKDILQGEFQRLSRETGVKGDQLKEAGWSGDKKDVMGLLEALDKVGKSRNWDVFVTKANSLNDIITILQNRFGEWSADMVNVVQPTIIGAFNSILSFGEGMAQGLTGIWEWLNTDGWGQTAVKIGVVGTALLTVSQALVQYRTGMGLAQTSQMNLTRQIASLVLGLKGQEIAEVGVRNAILGKIVGVKAETIAEKGMSFAIKESTLMNKLATVEEKMNTMALGENTVASKMQTIQAELNKLEKEGLILATERETIAEELNTIATENSTLATIEQEGANSGLIASLYMLGTGEAYATAETGALATAMGVLNGIFALSPIGWLTGALLALAGAFYVVTGGLSDTWDKMKSFNQTVDNASDSMQPYYDHLHKIKVKLDEAKSKYDESSEKVKKLQDRYDNAKKSVEDFNDALNEGINMKDNATQAYDEIGASIDELARSTLGKQGWSDKQLEDLDNLQYGADKYYHALQVLHKQVGDPLTGEIGGSNFEKDLASFSKSLDEAGIKGDEPTQKINDFKKNYMELAQHSYEANTSEDWWSWLWSSFYASNSQEVIDSNVLTNNIRKMFNVNWDEIGKEIFNFDFLDEEGTKNLEMITQWFDDNVNTVINGVITSFTNAFASFDFNGLLSSIIDLPRWIGEWVGNALGSLNLGEILQTHLGNVWNEAFAPLIQGVTVDFPNYVMSSIGRWSEVFSSLVSTVSSIFNGLKTRIWNTLTGIANNVSTGFNTVKDYAVSKVSAMQQGVKSAIDKVIGAFTHMKDMILDSAKKIWDGVKSKFDGVSKTIGGFYHKLTNPSEWFSGGGQKSWSSSPKPNTARRLFGVRSNGKHGAGSPNPYQKGNSGKTVTLDELVSQLGGNKRVNLGDFLSLFANSGFGGWDFAKKHKDTIYGKAKNWNANAPSMNGITLGTVYPLSRFWSGEAKGFTWDEFMRVAKAIFSNVPYKFYMDSDWKGNWVSALLSGAMNCSDGADALLALASLFGFSGEKIHTNLKNGTGHFYTRINGHNLDTTHFQNSGSWSPLSGGGSPVRHVGGYPSGKTVNITNDFSGATIYGVDDLDSRIKQSTKDALKEEFNDPWAVAI